MTDRHIVSINVRFRSYRKMLTFCLHKQIDSLVYDKHMYSLLQSPRQKATELLGKIANCKIHKNDKRASLLLEIKQINRTRTGREI